MIMDKEGVDTKAYACPIILKRYMCQLIMYYKDKPLLPCSKTWKQGIMQLQIRKKFYTDIQKKKMGILGRKCKVVYIRHKGALTFVACKDKYAELVNDHHYDGGGN